MIISSKKGIHSTIQERSAFLPSSRNDFYLMCQSVPEISIEDNFVINLSLNVRKFAFNEYPCNVSTNYASYTTQVALNFDKFGNCNIEEINNYPAILYDRFKSTDNVNAFYYSRFNGTNWDSTDLEESIAERTTCFVTTGTVMYYYSRKSGSLTLTSFALPLTWACCSVDGTIVLASSGTSLYISRNCGQSFSLLYTASGTIEQVACSSNTKYIFYSSGYDLYVSSNYGSSFLLYASLGATIQKIVSSYSGKYVMLKSSGIIYHSTNYGSTFTNKSITGVIDIAISGTGKYAIAVTTSAVAHYSANYSMPNSYVSTDSPMSSCTMSATGDIMYALSTGGILHKSTDYGASWINTGVVIGPKHIQCSGNGVNIFSSNLYTNVVYYSNNAGQSFNSQTLGSSAFSICCSKLTNYKSSLKYINEIPCMALACGTSVKYLEYGSLSTTIESGVYNFDHADLMEYNGRPFIVYEKSTLGTSIEIKYAYYDGVVWSTGTVDTISNGTAVNNIQLVEIGGMPAICYTVSTYSGSTTSYVKYATFDGTSWSIKTNPVSISGYESFAASIAEINGIPFICVFDPSNQRLALYNSTDDGATWTSEIIKSSLPINEVYCNMLNIDGMPAISAYYQDEFSLLRKSSYSDVYFDTTSLKTNSSTEAYRRISSILIDNKFYYTITPGYCGLQYISSRYNRISQTVDTSRIKNRCSGLINGNPAIAYPVSATSIKYYSYDGASWSNEDITSGTAITELSLCDILGSPAIAYLDGTTVYYCEYIGGWSIPTVIDTSCNGRVGIVSINDYPAIIYTKAGRLTATFYDGLNWNYFDIDAATSNGVKAIIQYNGYPLIVYQSTSSVLNSALFDGANWTIYTVPGSVAYSYLDITVFNSYPVIAALYNTTLYYGTFNGSSWNMGSISITCNISPISLEVIDDKPSILYTKTSTINEASRTISYISSLDSSGVWMTKSMQDYNIIMSVFAGSTSYPDLFTISSASVSGNYLDYIRYQNNISLESSQQSYLGASSQLSMKEILSYPSIAHTNGTTSIRYSKYNGSSWSTETITNPIYIVTKCSLAQINSQPAIAYVDAQPRLRYTRYDGASWSSPVQVYAASAKETCSLAEIDGQPAISCIFSGNLRYNRYNGASWVSTSVDASATTSAYSTYLLEFSGQPCILYISSSGSVKFAYYNGASWQTEVARSSSSTNLYASLINGNVAFVCYSSGYYIYGERINGVWQTEAIPMYASSSLRNFLKDINDRPCFFTDGYFCMRECVGTWSIYPLATSSLTLMDIEKLSSGTIAFSFINSTSSIQYTTMSIDSSESNNVIFRKGDSYYCNFVDGIDKRLDFSIKQTDNTEKTLSYRLQDKDFNKYAIIGDDGLLSLYVNGSLVESASYNNTVKQSSEALKIGGGGTKVDILVDDFAIWKNPAFSNTTVQDFVDFIHGEESGKRYEQIRSHWENPITIDSTGSVGTYTSIASIGGYPAIAYYDTTNEDLKYAEKSSGSWSVQVADNSGRLGQYASLVEYSGEPWIAYYASTSGLSTNDLKCARYTGGSWTKYTVDSSGAVGTYCCINIVNGYPAISYYDATTSPSVNQNLKYVAWTGAAWGTPEVVDGVSPAENVGTHTSLCDVDGQPAISYLDVTNKRLKYAVYNGSTLSWDKYVVDSGGTSGVGSYTSIATLDSGTVPIIAYYDPTNKRLKYAKQTSPGVWSITVVDSDYVGEYCRLVVIDNLPIIVYYDQRYTRIKYARYNGVSWVIENFYDLTGVGQYCSIANVGGRPHIAFYDILNTNLMYLAPTKHIFDF